MAAPVLSTLSELPTTLHKRVFIPVLQMGKLRHREVK